MKITIAERDFLSALTLYLVTRRTALRSALRLRAPLTVEDAEDLRAHYSNYFVSLMSAVDLVVENRSLEQEDFKKALEAGFKSLALSNNTDSYLYVRELRNAIVHRGLDVASSSHFAGDFPLLIAPNPIANRSGDKKHLSFSYYLLGIIEVCEAVIGPAIQAHLNTLGILEKTPDIEAWMAESIGIIKSSTVMPDWVKTMAPESLIALDWESMHRHSIAELRGVLNPLDFDWPSAN